VRGVAEYVADSDDSAEVAIVVEDAFQGRGIGGALFRRLVGCASARGIHAFTGDAGTENDRVVGMLRRGGPAVRLQPGYASARFTLRLDALARPI
jgi:GNAT superfamily N-acetyltransferase